jgi:hypothetical protein
MKCSDVKFNAFGHCHIQAIDGLVLARGFALPFAFSRLSLVFF